jgi:protein-tyrosine phosphatase
MRLKKLMILMLSFVALSAHAEIKNEQKILGGLLSRGGVMRRQPLNSTDLKNLCERGFTQAYTLYGGANKTVDCSRGTIEYHGSRDFRTPKDMNRILEDIHAGFTTKEKTFVHCNNGAHASGFVAAIALRTFCGLSADRAISYWDRTLNGYPLQEPNRSNLMKRIRNYPVRQELELSAGQKQTYGCPN